MGSKKKKKQKADRRPSSSRRAGGAVSAKLTRRCRKRALDDPGSDFIGPESRFYSKG